MIQTHLQIDGQLFVLSRDEDPGRLEHEIEIATGEQGGYVEFNTAQQGHIYALVTERSTILIEQHEIPNGENDYLIDGAIAIELDALDEHFPSLLQATTSSQQTRHRRHVSPLGRASRRTFGQGMPCSI